MLTLRFVKHTLSLAWSHKTRWTCKVRTAQKVPLNTCSESFNMCLVRLLSVTVFLPLCLTLSLFYSPEFRSVVYFRVFETQSQFVSPLKGLNYFWQSSNLNKHKCYERTHVKHLSQWLSQRTSSIIMAITSVFFFFFLSFLLASNRSPEAISTTHPWIATCNKGGESVSDKENSVTQIWKTIGHMRQVQNFKFIWNIKQIGRLIVDMDWWAKSWCLAVFCDF